MDVTVVALGVAGIAGTLVGAYLGYVLPRHHEERQEVAEAVVEVWEKLERLENSPVLWNPKILSQMPLIERKSYIDEANDICDEIKHILAIPHIEEVVWAAMEIREILSILQLPMKYDPKRLRRIAEVRELLQQSIENQEYVKAINKYYGDSTKELQEKYGVTPHLVTKDPATHESDVHLEEIPVRHRLWHLRRTKNCRRCNPKVEDENIEISARYDQKGNGK
jgi:hypothetical protein